MFASSRAIFLLRIGIIAWLYVIVMVGIGFYTTALNVLQNELAHFNGEKLAKVFFLMEFGFSIKI
jgi:hypothetical protein